MNNIKRDRVAMGWVGMDCVRLAPLGLFLNVTFDTGPVTGLGSGQWRDEANKLDCRAAALVLFLSLSLPERTRTRVVLATILHALAYVEVVPAVGGLPGQRQGHLKKR